MYTKCVRYNRNRMEYNRKCYFYSAFGNCFLLLGYIFCASLLCWAECRECAHDMKRSFLYFKLRSHDAWIPRIILPIGQKSSICNVCKDWPYQNLINCTHRMRYQICHWPHPLSTYFGLHASKMFAVHTICTARFPVCVLANFICHFTICMFAVMHVFVIVVIFSDHFNLLCFLLLLGIIFFYFLHFFFARR